MCCTGAGERGRRQKSKPARRLGLLGLAVGALACGASAAAGPVEGGEARLASESSGSSGSSEQSGKKNGAPQAGARPEQAAPDGAGKPAELPAPGKPMPRAEAQRYVLALVNRDRAAHKLPPVALDETAARAGQRHAEDMAKVGFTGHWGSDGSVPEERYTAAGGDGLGMENAGCFADGLPRELDPDPRFSAESLERVHQAFMNEKPPADGHRRNILTTSHTALGVGLAKAKGFDIACMAQEFVDDYGTYEAIPRRARVGDPIRIAGEVRSPATFAGVGLSRIELGKPLKTAKLLRVSSYPIPNPYATFFPKGFKTPIPVEVTGNRFSIQVPLDDHGRPGLYGVSVWATFPGSSELRMISLRTVATLRANQGGAP